MVKIFFQHLGLFLLILVISILETNCACSNGTGPSSTDMTENTGTGILSGRITQWPTSPVQQLGKPPPEVIEKAASGVKILIIDSAGKEKNSVVTDQEGRYSINLPPGSYQVQMDLPVGAGFSKDLPATIAIAEGQETQLDILIDTGIR